MGEAALLQEEEEGPPYKSVEGENYQRPPHCCPPITQAVGEHKSPGKTRKVIRVAGGHG